MPVITVELSRKPTEVKAELIKELSETAARVTGIPQDKFIVLINEYETENIGVGGKPLSEILA